MTKRTAQLIVALEVAAPLAAAWALLPDVYHTALYRVDRIGVPLVSWFAPCAIILILALAAASLRRRASGEPFFPLLARAWLPLLANLAIILRAVSGLEPFFLEPLLIAVSLGAALWLSLTLPKTPSLASSPNSPRAAAVLSFAVAALAAVWFYWVQSDGLSKLAYGYMDAGIYYQRVKNTALLRGLLQETLSRPPFYDHFDIGLLFLVPVYWIFPSFKMIMWVQALFLAATAPAIYLYARGRGIAPWAAAGLGVTALLHPSISQMNYSFSYGFHPVSLSLAAVIVSIYFWEKRRWGWFAAFALFASSMEETILPFYLGLGLVELVSSKSFRRPAAILAVASLALFLVITKLIMPHFAGAENYAQLAKYSHLGSNVREILLSAVTKPALFWGLICSKESAVFLALITGSVGFLPLLAPRKFLYSIVVLIFVLLLANPDVKSISFQYQIMIVAATLVAAVAGAGRLAPLGFAPSGFASFRAKSAESSEPASAAVPIRFAPSVLAILACAVIASHFYGILPWSRITVPFEMRRNEAFMQDAAAVKDLAAATPRTARVLATMRVATLFVDAGLVELVSDRLGGTDYDLAVLQTDDTWGQSPEETTAVFNALANTGKYEFRALGRFLVLTRSPRTAPAPGAGPAPAQLPSP